MMMKEKGMEEGKADPTIAAIEQLIDRLDEITGLRQRDSGEAADPKVSADGVAVGGDVEGDEEGFELEGEEGGEEDAAIELPEDFEMMDDSDESSLPERLRKKPKSVALTSIMAKAK